MSLEAERNPDESSSSRWRILAIVLISALAMVELAPVLEAQEVPVVVRDRLDEADALRREGKLDDSIAAYRAAIQIQPNASEAYLALGSIHHQRGDLREAYEVFSAGLTQNPSDQRLCFNSAVVALALEKYEDALGHAKRLTDSEPKNAGFALLYGSALSSLDRLPEAIEAHERATRLDPKNAQGWLRFGNLLHRAERHEEAVRAFRTALERDRRLQAAQYNLGAVLFETGQFSEALEAYRVALEPYDLAFAKGEEVAAGHARAYVNLGTILNNLEDWQPALDAYQKAIRLQPDLGAAWYGSGLALENLGKPFEALSAFVKVVELDPTFGVAYLHLGRLYQQAGDHAGVVSWLEKASPYLNEEQSLESMQLMAVGLSGLGRSAEAMATFERLLTRDPTNIEALLAVGRSRRLSGDDLAAKSLLERAADLAPQRIEPALELAELARASGDFQAQESIYRRVLEAGGGEGQSWRVELNLALLLLSAHQIPEARALTEGIDQRFRESQGTARPGSYGPRDAAFVATLLGYLMIREEDFEAAREQLERAVELDRSLPEAVSGLAVLEALEQRFDQALELLDSRLSAIDEPRLEAMMKGNRALIGWLSGELSSFHRQQLEQTASQHPDWLALQLAVGELALANGNPSLAVDHLERARAGCDGGDLALHATTVGLLIVGDETAICPTVDRYLSSALAQLSLQQLSSSAARAERLADQALSLDAISLDDASVARFVRGSARLALGKSSAARRDLVNVVSSGLSSELLSAAEINLAVAEYRTGRSAAALQRLRSVRTSQSRNAEAILNLGILLETELKQGEEALALYEEYVGRSGARQGEVRSWISRLREIYR